MFLADWGDNLCKKHTLKSAFEILLIKYKSKIKIYVNLEENATKLQKIKSQSLGFAKFIIKFINTYCIF